MSLQTQGISMGVIVSRRGLLEGSLVIAASASTRQAATAQADAQLSEAQKITHADAKYQPTPNGQQRCEICLQFEPPDHCKIVRSPISVTGSCQYFAARENAH
jgi:hypothetical protein